MVIDFVEGKYRQQYAKKHGLNSLINYFHDLPWNDEESERVYKLCLEKDITWEKYYGYAPKNVIY